MDKIRNEYIRGTAQVGRFGEKTREARLRMELPGRRKRGKPKRRFMDVVKEDMAEVEVTKIGTTGDGKSAVVTPDGKSWKKHEP